LLSRSVLNDVLWVGSAALIYDVYVRAMIIGLDRFVFDLVDEVSDLSVHYLATLLRVGHFLAGTHKNFTI
jgi:hypothetical protein